MGNAALILAALTASYLALSACVSAGLMFSMRDMPCRFDVPTAFRFGTLAVAWPWVVGPLRRA